MTSPYRLFVTQQFVDQWLADSKAQLEGEVLTVSETNQSYRLGSAVRFMRIVEGQDDKELLGKVKGLEQLQALDAEHYRDSVILGENAYEVMEGFLGEPLQAESLVSGENLAEATLAAVHKGTQTAEIDLLAKVFLEST